MASYLDASMTAPKKIRPDVGALPATLALFKTIVEELDAALGRK